MPTTIPPDMGDEVRVEDRRFSLVNPPSAGGVITEMFGDLVEPGRAAG